MQINGSSQTLMCLYLPITMKTVSFIASPVLPAFENYSDEHLVGAFHNHWYVTHAPLTAPNP